MKANDPYCDIHIWTWEQLKREEEAIYTDFNSGLFDYHTFEKIFGVVNAEIRRRRQEEYDKANQESNYDRAMSVV